ncbi:LysR family transcriptional regulator [Kutzneria viridogrisea]|uniref:Transcription regulator, LysR family n=2 Tax=Kutzneria TaxID=43356 RepID=W5W7C8_9PSEU|nr:LysR family transcriptional regulator [Kutzneria albida]AHH96822.1 transcription regulator, LysR family [Kutzneria albida DSM 43870]MBA8927957.1 DNA-binding transcriptional LysR family regulator [Kutzneria viridogrisea]
MPMPPNLSGVDLNLLLPLHALLTERNVTRAAERVGVGQPAMSASLAKLRRLFDDPLLVRDGRGLVLTPFAESLLGRLAVALSSVRAVLDTEARFDPATDHRVFTIVASDYVTAVLLRPLLVEVSRTAPHVRINIVSLQPDFLDRLRRGQCDLLIWPRGMLTENLDTFASAELFGDEFVAVVDGDNPHVGEQVDLDELATLPYVQVAGTLPAMPDTSFSLLGLTPRTAVATETFCGALHMVPGTDMVAIVQRRLFDQFGPALGLRMVRLPVELPRLTEAAFWHQRFRIEPAHRWLRELLQQLSKQL